jgi:hypothetical protein
MGSHSVHLDGDAILMMHEREHRDELRQRTIELAHGVREISDVKTFAMIRALAAYDAHGLDPQPIREVNARYEGLARELREAYELWHSIEFSTPSS